MAEYAAHLADLRKTFASGRTRPAEWRVRQLERLKALLKEREAEIFAAVREDFGKCTYEAYLSETGYTTSECDYVLSHLAGWLKPEKVATPLITQPGSSYIVREPYGVVLIIGPWNYPVQLVLAPLIGAIAAGNCAVIKPSELTPTTSRTLAKLVPQYLDPECVRVVEGDAAATTELLEQPWDYIFFTGGTGVGRVVMQAAAKHLTPVTLELGGKSPCIVDADADLGVAAMRIAWGKTLNAGQTCLAPDYILAHEKIERELTERIAAAWRDFYGPDPKASPDFARIVNSRHFERVKRLLGSGEVVCGGDTDAAQRYIAPTLLRNVSPDSPVMQEEIFGPVLPVLGVKSMEEAVSFVNGRDKPLALYVFSGSKRTQRLFVENTSSGDVCINDVIAHYGVPELPFGGVGASGMGTYHGRSSFDTFSHKKGVLAKWQKVDPPVRYPPYTDTKLSWLRRLM